MPENSRSEFTHRSIIAFAIAAVLFLAWQLGPVLLLVFGGLVLAVVIRVAAHPVSRLLSLPGHWAVLIIVLLIAIGLGLVLYFFGTELMAKVQDLNSEITGALKEVRQWLSGFGLSQGLSSAVNQALSTSRFLDMASATVSFLVDLVLVLLVAIYIAMDPALYRRGTMAMVPVPQREQVGTALDAAGRALRGWLKGQLISMALVAMFTSLGLWLIGVPLPFALGLIAGILEFVPILGPWLAAVPGVLLAFTVSPVTALYAAGIYLVIQQLESNLIMPLAQQWMVRLPPALCLLAIVVFGVLFGLPGLLFAAPLTVVIMALVRSLYLDREPV